jgi:hypothetical protein
MDATDLLERQHRRVFHQIGRLAVGRHVSLLALHDLIGTMLAHMSVVETLGRLTLLRGPLPADVITPTGPTRTALAELAQSRVDRARFAIARWRLERAFHAHVAHVRAELLPRVAQAFDPLERRVLGRWLAHFYLARRGPHIS